ncbi:MAG: Smr/MutS family protein, partial [Bacilli bacterium]
PCHEVSYVPFIDEVYFLGGDNQSVLDNLSTFSSHLVGIKHITENSTSKSLVIIDEVGEGTSPKDGEALAVALLKFFENRTCYTILTSHFDGLKFYAAKDDKAMTGAMEFNNDSLKPTYRLLLHTTGKSYGLQLAKSIGLDPSIIKDAMEFEKSQANQDVNSLMEKLTVQESENSKLQRELINKKKDLERAIEKRELAIRSLNEEKSSIHQKAQEKVERLVDQRLKDMDAIWKNKQASESYGEFSKAKGELNKIKTDTSNLLVINEKAKVLIDLKVGDLVDDEDSRRATVIEIKKNEVILDLDGLRFRRPIAGLKRGHLRASDIKKKEKKNDDIVSIDLAPSKGLELNIIGQRVDEAMRNVVSFIDGAKIRKLGYIRIVHGMGSFALKNAVWKYLQNHPGLVKDYRLGVQGEGGMGATIIHL